MIHLQKMFLRLVSLAILLVATSFAVHTAPTRPDGVIPLTVPSFVGVAYAANDPSVAKALSALQDEAGISAYFNKGSSINLNLVRGLYRTIEVDNGSYILGSMQATGTRSYLESEDPHVYVSTSGWVMAYYLNADPAAKIIDVWNYNGGTTINTKLEIALGRVATAISAGSPTISFYDFRSPNATKLLLVADLAPGSDDSFQINLPGTPFTYYEESWALSSLTGCCTNLVVDGVIVAGVSSLQNKYGVLAPLLGTDQTHTFLVDVGYDSVGGLAVIYRDTP